MNSDDENDEVFISTFVDSLQEDSSSKLSVNTRSDGANESETQASFKLGALTKDKSENSGNQGTASPTGYRGPHPPLPQIPSIDDDLIHKTILLGDSGVGKTSILVRFDTGKFQQGTFSATVGIGFTNKVIDLDDTKVKLQIWDTAGQERFRSVTHAYYRDAHALLLLYDVTNKTSFENTREWLAEVHEYAQDDVVIMLIGNKCDALPSERRIRREEGEKLAKEYNVPFMETSAKSGVNVDLAFTAVAKDLKNRRKGKMSDSNFNVAKFVENEQRFANCIC